MSASTAHRTARLIRKIADERAARNKTATTAKPRLARSYTTSVGAAPENRGSAAELGTFQIALGAADPLPVPYATRVRSLIYKEYVVGGTFIDHPIGPTYDPIVASLELLRGIDYPEYLATYSNADQQRQHRIEIPTFQKPEVDLIDRLFGGKWSGRAT